MIRLATPTVHSAVWWVRNIGYPASKHNDPLSICHRRTDAQESAQLWGSRISEIKGGKTAVNLGLSSKNVIANEVRETTA
jgi:hypothetical protein